MDYIPRSGDSYQQWLLNLKTQIAVEGPKFGLTAAEITAITDQCEAQLALAQAVADAESKLSGARQAEKIGKTTTDAALRSAIAGWKGKAGFTAANASALRVVASAAVFNADEHKPEFNVRIVGGEIRLDWKKGGSQGVHVYSRLRGQANWTLIGMDTSSPYIDGRPLAQPGVPEVREYMLRGVVKDQEIGQDSDVMSITWSGQ